MATSAAADVGCSAACGAVSLPIWLLRRQVRGNDQKSRKTGIDGPFMFNSTQNTSIRVSAAPIFCLQQLALRPEAKYSCKGASSLRTANCSSPTLPAFPSIPSALSLSYALLFRVCPYILSLRRPRGIISAPWKRSSFGDLLCSFNPSLSPANLDAARDLGRPCCSSAPAPSSPCTRLYARQVVSSPKTPNESIDYLSLFAHSIFRRASSDAVRDRRKSRSHSTCRASRPLEHASRCRTRL